MYNGIGLTTPRGSGTNGYVMRNLSVLRNHETAEDRAAAWKESQPKHRTPDAGILEHERLRKVEVACLALQLELEDQGEDEEKIEEQVSALRTKLQAALPPPSVADGKSLKPSDTHAIAAAKQREMDKMARALGTRADYDEGDAFNREKQEELRQRRATERIAREEERAKVAEQKAKWEVDRKERERLRRREEDRLRKAREEGRDRGYAGRDKVTERDRERMPPPSGPARGSNAGFRRSSRSRSPPRRGPPSRSFQSRDDEPRKGLRRRSPSPPPRTSVRGRGDSSSPPRRASYGRADSQSPPPRRGRSDSRSPPRHVHSKSRSPLRRDRSDSRSPRRPYSRSPRRNYSRSSGRSVTRSPSPPNRSAPRRRSYSPRGRSPSQSRSRSRSPEPRNRKRGRSLSPRSASPVRDRASKRSPSPRGRSRSSNSSMSMSDSSDGSQ